MVPLLRLDTVDLIVTLRDVGQSVGELDEPRSDLLAVTSLLHEIRTEMPDLLLHNFVQVLDV